MSTESAKQFLLRVESDPDILDGVSNKIDCAKTADEKLGIIVSFAQSIGYDFTARDIDVVSSEIGNVDNDSAYDVYGGSSNLKNKVFSKIKFLKDNKV